MKVTASSIDYETKSRYTIGLRVTDKDVTSPLSCDTEVLVIVLDINEPPAMVDTSFTVRKHSAILPAVGDLVSAIPFVATDVDISETSLSYAIVSGNTNNHWSISADVDNAMIAHLTLATANPSTGTETLQVSVTDSHGKISLTNAAVTVIVVESNRAPEIICYANSTVDSACSFEVGEDQLPGTVAATLGGVDAEGDGVVFSIVAGNELGVFTISQTILGGSVIAEIQLTEASSSIIDHEATDVTGKGSFRLVVVCTDDNATPLYSGMIVEVSISDQNEVSYKIIEQWKSY